MKITTKTTNTHHNNNNNNDVRSMTSVSPYARGHFSLIFPQYNGQAHPHRPIPQHQYAHIIFFFQFFYLFFCLLMFSHQPPYTLPICTRHASPNMQQYRTESTSLNWWMLYHLLNDRLKNPHALSTMLHAVSTMSPSRFFRPSFGYPIVYTKQGKEEKDNTLFFFLLIFYFFFSGLLSRGKPYMWLYIYT